MSENSKPTPERPPSIDQIARAISDLGLPHPLLVDAARDAVNRSVGNDVLEEARKIGESISRRLIVTLLMQLAFFCTLIWVALR